MQKKKSTVNTTKNVSKSQKCTEYVLAYKNKYTRSTNPPIKENGRSRCC